MINKPGITCAELARFQRSRACSSAQVEWANGDSRRTKVLDEFRRRAHPRDQQAVPRPRAGDVEQVALGLINVVQLRLVGNRAWFKKCRFQVTPKIDKTLVVKGFLVGSCRVPGW